MCPGCYRGLSLKKVYAPNNTKPYLVSVKKEPDQKRI